MSKNIHFPTVWRRPSRKGKQDRSLVIVFRNRVEYYHEIDPMTEYSGEDYDPYNEEEMLMGNGWKKVHYGNDCEG